MVFTFVDLCAGIGGFHIACKRQRGVCVGAVEIDAFAREVYFNNHDELPESDVNTMILPRGKKVDLVCFGNPCQSFSWIGFRKGLKDARGKLFFAICAYLESSGAKCFIMENVKSIMYINGGKDFDRICALLKRIGYNVSYEVINAQDSGLPQHRERVFIVGHRSKVFTFPKKKETVILRPLRLFLDPGPPSEKLITDRFAEFDLTRKPDRNDKSGFVIRAQFNRYTEKRLFSSDGSIGTVMSSHSPFIYDERYGVSRHLSTSELLRCHGIRTSELRFPERTSRTRALKYIGNAVCPPVVADIIGEMQRQGLIPR